MNISSNVWHQMVWTRRADGVSLMYMDGNTVAEGANAGAIAFGSVGNPLYVGSNFSAPGSPVLSMSGAIDEVAVYGYDLSASQVLAHYNAAAPEPTSAVLLGSALIGLLAYAWRKRK